VAYISQVVYVDEGHVALSFQFFNKTRQNILANPHASVLVLDPVTARFYRLHLRYLRTETSGALFESMKAQLAGIASHNGMADVFRLKGSDVYAVLHIDAIDGEGLPPAPGARVCCTACASAASAWRAAPGWTNCCNRAGLPARRWASGMPWC
jgi:adenylate cyclase